MDSKKKVHRSKCQNEKRRREQENIYIEDLAELISSNSCTNSIYSQIKPDKCAILQETVKQITEISTQELEKKPFDDTISNLKLIRPDSLGHIFLKALDGFLVYINHSTAIYYISNNIGRFLPDIESNLLIGKSFKDFLHPDDFCAVDSIIHEQMNMFNKIEKFSINCRFRTCLSSMGVDYENFDVVVNSLTGFNLDYGERHYFSDQLMIENVPFCVLIIRKLSPVEEFTRSGKQFLIVSTKLSCKGYKVLHVENACYNRSYKVNKKSISQSIVNFCHPSDTNLLTRHYNEVKNSGSNVSTIYRLSVCKGSYCYVRTESRIFLNQDNNWPMFIISNHTIIRTCDSFSDKKTDGEKTNNLHLLDSDIISFKENNTPEYYVDGDATNSQNYGNMKLDFASLLFDKPCNNDNKINLNSVQKYTNTCINSISIDKELTCRIYNNSKLPINNNSFMIPSNIKHEPKEDANSANYINQFYPSGGPGSSQNVQDKVYPLAYAARFDDSFNVQKHFPLPNKQKCNYQPPNYAYENTCWKKLKTLQGGEFVFNSQNHSDAKEGISSNLNRNLPIEVSTLQFNNSKAIVKHDSTQNPNYNENSISYVCNDDNSLPPNKMYISTVMTPYYPQYVNESGYESHFNSNNHHQIKPRSQFNGNPDTCKK